ncbi:type 1 glutamine amidotransferase [Salinigranum salinum]|uniref:type 1 glutamine amidotransferase n=1 Tax=Salinigranum salinum TaxID=1364937 RepID=UPI00126135C0|nr:type 1 glutamine amidotransferase [Salinigranum salinum]
MDRTRFALLDASHGSLHTPRNFRRELDASLAEFDVTQGELPETFDYDGVVITGSRASVYWDEPWIRSLVDWTADAAARGLPTLGVCYGHQVLAEALGGRVAALGEYEIGYRTVEQTRTDADLFGGVPEAFTAFTTHSDHVVDLPPGATLLAENEYGVHAFRKGHAFGVQFHPEYDPETAATVTRGKDDQLSDERIQRVLDGITDEQYAAACETKRLFGNFVDYARRVRDGPAAAAD